MLTTSSITGHRDTPDHLEQMVFSSPKIDALRPRAEWPDITRNSRDFGKGPEPLTDLTKDLEIRGLRTSSIRIFPSLADLNEQIILPKLKPLNDMAESLQTESLKDFSLRRWVNDEIVEALHAKGCDELVSPLEQGHASVYISRLSKIKSLQVDDVRLLPSGDALVSAGALVTLNLSVDADWERYQLHSDVRSFFGSDGGAFEWASIDYPVDVTVLFSLILEDQARKVVSYEIDTLEGGFGTIEFAPHPQRDAT